MVNYYLSNNTHRKIKESQILVEKRRYVTGDDLKVGLLLMELHMILIKFGKLYSFRAMSPIASI